MSVPMMFIGIWGSGKAGDKTEGGRKGDRGREKLEGAWRNHVVTSDLGVSCRSE